MRTLIVMVLSVLVLATAATAAPSGLKGVVVRGPLTPVCRVGIPCSAPAKHVVLTFARGGRSWRTTTDDHGRYRIPLHPGVYAVTASMQRPWTRAFTAVVPHGRVATRNFELDTGIR